MSACGKVSRTIFSGSAAGGVGVVAVDAAAAACCSGASSLRPCACAAVAAGDMGWRFAGLATGSLPALVACIAGSADAGVAAIAAVLNCAVGLADAATAVAVATVVFEAGAVGSTGFAGAGMAAGLLATVDMTLPVASLASWVLAAGALTIVAGLTSAASCCAAGVADTAGATGAATTAGGVVSGACNAACGISAAAGATAAVAICDGAGACHSRCPATAATASSTTPPATAPSLNFIVGAGLAGTARTCP